MSEKQCTIKKAVSLTGVGLHTGKKVTLTFNPAPENHWYKFQRIDLEGQPIIEADADLVVDTSRGTVLEKNGARVHTIEHVLAALRGLEIDNCLIQVDGPEMPIMDGSSIKFIEALELAERVEQNAPREYFVLKNNLTYEDTEKNVEMLAVPQETFRTTVMVDYNSDILGTQHASIYALSEFKKEVANCRTFVFLHELEMLLQHNLIKGGDLDNAIVLVDKELPKEKLDHLRKVFHKEKDHIDVKRGVLNNTKLHHYNEPARHKLLDIVGDLALVGKPMKVHILAARPGHAGNVAFAKKIKELIKKEKKEGNIPQYDTSAPALYNTVDIMKILPHRYPFLLVDKILELTPQYVVGVKNVTYNEFWCQGHFPDEPIMPGVLIIEALAQTGGVLCLKTVPDPENYQTYFVKIESAKFKNKVTPGDTVVFKMELAEPIRRGLCHMKGTAYVGNKIAAEADMMAQIVKVRGLEKKVMETQNA
ncbi:MAG: bifunctional UDP-3-O-[3-hydroxymyristoyl] N-acetylglucosamine deacetylase/3-hydroxyacyl-ACP dehydratase [Bacteroidetes bacterium]|nr:bifunctional UDP-3-O-[3-hydroxymyristoyl] N-acetylglucosamine deacetylase/3-hydroxyacyl-ACP dehydratase [Bacteroidota bacterium]